MVYLVGAGAGDVGLLTLRACELLRAADVVIYDRLIDDTLLNFCAGAKKIYVGKEAGRHTLKQSEINQLLVNEAQQNKIVVRLKGGDPFVFGRGGEEALTLRENNLPFEIVPGVTSAVAVPAYAGIPVTHRGIATSFAVVTGHEDPSKPESSIRWDKLANAVDTLIFLMGVANLPQIVDKLITHGRSPDTPAALIRNGTRPAQEVIVTTLAEAPNANVKPPAIFVVGEVVNLRDKLKWFDTRPLFGKKILVTRARAQASKLSSALKNLGATVVECPTIKIAATTDSFKRLDAAIDNMRGFDWLIFTSGNGVENFFARLKIHGMDTRALGGVKVAAIGSATSEKLSSFGIAADVVPKNFVAENSLTIGETTDNIDAAIDNMRGFDWLIFTSGNGVENFFARLKFHGMDTRALGGVKVAAIGSATADKLSTFGIVADVVPKNFVAESLAEALKNLVDGKKILLARAEDARDVLPDMLKNFGAEVTVAPAYQTVSEVPAPIDFASLDMMTFTSSSTVKNFVAAHGVDALKKIPCAAIGPITAKTLETFGVTPAVVAEEFTIGGLVDAVKNFYGGIDA